MSTKELLWEDYQVLLKTIYEIAAGEHGVATELALRALAQTRDWSDEYPARP